MIRLIWSMISIRSKRNKILITEGKKYLVKIVSFKRWWV